MDDSYDIYEDLPSYDANVNETDSKNLEDTSKECEKLKKEVSELTLKLGKLQKANETLEVNFSSLLKTAKAEIARKDKTISELRKQVDDMSFRRGRFNRNVRMQQAPAREYNNVQTHIKNERSNSTNNNEYCSQEAGNHNYHPSDEEEAATDYEGRRAKNQEPYGRSTTVFTERWRKRINEEREAERRKLASKEEEKSSQVDDKENHSNFSTQISKVDTANSKCKEVEDEVPDDANVVEENAASMENERRLALSTKVAGKRLDNDLDVPCSKRPKLDREEDAFVDKNGFSKKEDILNGYPYEFVPNRRKDKADYEEEFNGYSEKNSWSDSASLKSYDAFHKRKEHYRKSSNDYNNYPKDSMHYHEKDKYNRTRHRSPVSRYSEKKHKYHDDRYRDNRDKFDRRRNFYDKEEDASNPSDKRSYDLRNKDKYRSNEKYSKENRYLHSGISRSHSVSHERSKSNSRERTSHKIYDKRSSKPTRCNDDSEERGKVSSKRKDERIELKATIESKKKDEKADEKSSLEVVEDGEIVEECCDEFDVNNVQNEAADIARKGVEDSKDSVKEENKESNDRPEMVEDLSVTVKNVNTDNVGNVQNSGEDASSNCKTEEKSICKNTEVIGDDVTSDENQQGMSRFDDKHGTSKDNSEGRETITTTKPMRGNEEKDDNGNERAKVKEKTSECDDSRVIVLARRRKHVKLADNNASMTVVINAHNANSNGNAKDRKIVESDFKLRACKLSRCKDEL